jgi:hypothetical protein
MIALDLGTGIWLFVFAFCVTVLLFMYGRV